MAPTCSLPRWPAHGSMPSGTTPPPPQMPLQTALVAEAQLRINKSATKEGSGAQQLANYFVGQVVGQMDRVRPARQVVLDMVTEYAEVAQEFADQVAATTS